jgi:uncharacterized protein (PEP-CTERM system associated)
MTSPTRLSGSRFSRMIWTLDANAKESQGSRDVSTIFAAASAEYPLNRFLSLFGSIGYEQISDSTLDDGPDGPIGSAGVRLAPGPRTSVELLYNHRFDSDFVTGNAGYLIGPQSRIVASYSERIGTSQSLFADNLSFLARDEFGNFIDSRTAELFSLGDTNFGLQDNAFRLRTFSLSLHVVRGRTTWDAVAFHERRDINALNEQDTAIGGGVNWSHRIAPITTFNMTARYRRESFETPAGTDDQHLVGGGASLVQNLNESLDGVLAVSFTRQFAEEPSDEFIEAIASVGLVKRF